MTQVGYLIFPLLGHPSKTKRAKKKFLQLDNWGLKENDKDKSSKSGNAKYGNELCGKDCVGVADSVLRPAVDDVDDGPVEEVDAVLNPCQGNPGRPGEDAVDDPSLALSAG